MLDTDQLRSFLAIVDTGSFTRAAARVNKTQSAVSMHIRRLEEQLQRRLFEKRGRGVRLSEDGERLVEYARGMLSLEASALSAIARKGLAGTVRFGIPDDYAEPFLADILARFMQTHPLVEVSVLCDNSLSLGERVRRGEVDLALVTDCAPIPNVEVVREEPLRWVAGPRYRMNADAPLPLALSGPTCAWRQAVEQALSTSRLRGRVVLASSSFAAIRPMVMAGVCVTVLPASAVRGGMRILGESEGLPPLASTRIGLVCASGVPSAEAAELAQNIRLTLADMPNVA